MTIPQFTAGQVLTAAELNAMVDAINAGGGKMEVQQFTASGTFTVPAGVTHAVAHIRAGGGGIAIRDRGTPTVAAGAGGTSSVAFASGTISATGGNPANVNGQMSGEGLQTTSILAGIVNSGQGAFNASQRADSTTGGMSMFQATAGAEIVAGGAVTPAASITVTVGAGGTAGGGAQTSGAAGGSGYVWIEYQL